MHLSHGRRRALVAALCFQIMPGALLSASAQEAPMPAPEMQSVLEKLKELQAKPVATLAVPEARMQASAADAARGVQRDKTISPAPESKVMTKDIAIPTKNGSVPARLYIPDGTGPLPVVVYYHGGGWVIADINTYDASARSLALGSGAIVVSADYRHAPEAKFPAQHQDAYDAYVWVVENIGSQNGDSSRIAVAGESAGGNLAAPAAPEMVPKHAAMLKQLEAAEGADFQTLYIDMQWQAHMEAVALFRTYAGSGEEAVVAFAKETLPTLEMHMSHVKDLVKAH